MPGPKCPIPRRNLEWFAKNPGTGPPGVKKVPEGLTIAGIEIPSDSPVFISILALHVPIGVLAVVSGAGAMLTEKKRGIHTTFGSIYFCSLATLFATSSALAALRWSEDYHLFALGALAFLTGLVGRETRRRRWVSTPDLHITGMGVSYIVMLTAFYVDNGKNLPIWRDLPPLAYWIIPGAVGIPLIMKALIRSEKRVRLHEASLHQRV